MKYPIAITLSETDRASLQTFIQWLVDQVYPNAEYIRIVQDNLNTHTASALADLANIPYRKNHELVSQLYSLDKLLLPETPRQILGHVVKRVSH